MGSGQYAVVYSVQDEEGRKYALKSISTLIFESRPHIVKLFKTEIKVMQTVDHPRILKMYEYFEYGENKMAVVTDLCDGGSLESLMINHYP